MRRIVTALMLVLAGISLCAGGGHAEPPRRWLPVDEDGWTVLRPSADSRIIYVSSGAGDDDGGRAYRPDHPAVGDDPFHPTGPLEPFRTVSAAICSCAPPASATSGPPTPAPPARATC